MKRKTPKLGQHFLTGTWAATRLAASVAAGSDETILEIGPGKGALTQELLKTGAKVIAVEKDRELITKLSTTFAHEIADGSLTVIDADIRNVVPEKLGLKGGAYVVAANIPYYITGEIIRQFLTAGAQPRAMALLVQKEVAQRIIAGDSKESILSLSVKAYGAPKIVAKVSRGNFSPPPSVDSAILLIETISRDFFNHIDESLFFKIVRAGFSSKRKILSSNLGTAFGKSDALNALQTCAVSPTARAEDVPLSTWREITKELEK